MIHGLLAAGRAYRGLMKRDHICVGWKDSGLDLSGNDLAETMIDELDDRWNPG